jgi:hypothetical protein
MPLKLDAQRVAEIADWRDLRRRGWGHETGDGRQQGDEDHEAAAHQRRMAQN